MKKIICIALNIAIGIITNPVKGYAEYDLHNMDDSTINKSEQIMLESSKQITGNNLMELKKMYPKYSPAIEGHYEKYGLLPDVIGWTDVSLTLVSDSTGNYVIPTTEINDLPRAIGGVSYSPYGNLTLYTAASFRGSDIYASSIAEYSTLSASINDRPARGMYDYISITFPTVYTIDPSYGISSSNYSSYRADENGAVMGVMLDATPSAQPYTYVSMNGIGKLNGNKPSICKIISSYTHNYNTLQLSVSLNPGTGSISVSPSNKTWTIVASVSI